jgi:hypothetical protein
LCRNYQLVEYIQYMLSEDGTVQLVWVLVHLRPSYTLCLLARRSFWSLRDFFWISLIIINLQIPFVWGEPVSESIVGVLCCCPCACHSCWWRLLKRWCFGWISHLHSSYDWTCFRRFERFGVANELQTRILKYVRIHLYNTYRMIYL